MPRSSVKERSPAKQLAGFIAKYSPAVARTARAALAKMRARLPGSLELVYDNYNALAIGFGPTQRSSEAIFSIALYPRWVSLFFLRGAKLADPHQLLRGKGTTVRHIVLENAATLDKPAVQALIGAALAAGKPIDARKREGIIIKSISPKQRPRRPA